MKNNLQKLRWTRDWSQEQLARKSGVSRALISSIENHTELNPSVGAALKLSHALNVKVEDIFTI